MIPVERTHEYRGRYHVLGGALSPIDGVEPENLKIAELYARVERADPPVREVVLATNPTTTGRGHARCTSPTACARRAPDVAVTRLASGLPVGGDLEYADEVTLGRAFAGRRARLSATGRGSSGPRNASVPLRERRRSAPCVRAHVRQLARQVADAVGARPAARSAASRARRTRGPACR